MKFLTGSLILLIGCTTPEFRPKPRSYPRVFLPEKSYFILNEQACPFTFSAGQYTSFQPDTSFFDQKPIHDCWFDLYYPDFNARLHFSYYPIGGRNKGLDILKDDAFKMADWHNKRANYIDEVAIEHPESNVSGFIFFIDGPAASPLQFYVTDSTQHFLRGSLYFNTVVQPDSLAPMYQFIREDVLILIETLRWKY
jgi:gliding motility-associated lipoprotein GldD